MAVTVSITDYDATSTRRVAHCDVTFDSSYPFGGEALTANTLGMEEITNVVIEGKYGYTFEYDATNSKIKVFASAPPVVYEESQTIAYATSVSQVTLNYPAAALLNIATATNTQKVIDVDDTLAANECQLAAAMAAGERTSVNFHTATTGAVKCTYITQAWADIWNNRTASTTITTSSSIADLTEAACLIESINALNSGGTSVSSRPSLIQDLDTAATGEAAVDWVDTAASNTTTLTFATTDAVYTAEVTYIGKPSSGFLNERFVDDEQVTLATGGTGNTTYAMIFNSLGSQIPDYTTGGFRATFGLMMPEGDALGTANECRIDWHRLGSNVGHQLDVQTATGATSVAMAYVYGYPHEIPNLVPLEVPNGHNLTNLSSVKATVFGR